MTKDRCPYCGNEGLTVNYTEICGKQTAMMLECKKCGKLIFAGKNVKVVALD